MLRLCCNLSFASASHSAFWSPYACRIVSDNCLSTCRSHVLLASAVSSCHSVCFELCSSFCLSIYLPHLPFSCWLLLLHTTTADCSVCRHLQCSCWSSRIKCSRTKCCCREGHTTGLPCPWVWQQAYALQQIR